MRAGLCTRIAMICGMLTLAVVSVRAGYPSGYYDSLEGKSGAALIEAIGALADNHTEINYSGGTWEAFLDTDIKTVNGTDYWWDMYSNDLVSVSSGHPGLNVEHSVANSWWGGTKNAAYKDIVHLNPSNADANSRKSNYPLAELGTVKWTNGVTSVGTPKSGQGGGNSWGYEPADQYKGDFARVFMYMFTTYRNISWKSTTDWMYDTSQTGMFRTWAAEMLMRWHNADPVSDKERRRNDGIQKNQKNRNPFIDLPDLADYIWGSKKGNVYYLDGHGDGGDTEDPGPAPDNQWEYDWLGQSDANMGDWTIENIKLPEGGTSVWKWGTSNGRSYLSGSAYISGTPRAAEAYAWSPAVSLAGSRCATVSFEHAAKFQTTLQNLCSMVVRDNDSGEISSLEIRKWPAPDSWTFVGSGDIDLSDYIGRNISIGFRYRSDSSGADTWEIDNVRLRVERDSGIVSPADEEDDSFLVEVWGRSIAVPDGARIYDMNGREVSGPEVAPGVYVVVKPTFRQAVKIFVK